tara:strand:- start:4068 stop:4337 length:270 start_codon:yes stop_codon:yes gene_type:complete
MGVQDQIIKYKDDEKFQKAPPILPHDLEKVTELLGNIFSDLADLRNKLSTASQNPEMNKVALSNLVSKIDEINEVIVLEIPEDLANIGI